MLTIFLVVEKSKGEGSAWYPYIQSLPQTYETPCFASKGEASCFPSFLKRIDSTQRHLIQQKYSQCRQSLVQTATMSFNDFRWAWITVNRWEHQRFWSLHKFFGKTWSKFSLWLPVKWNEIPLNRYLFISFINVIDLAFKQFANINISHPKAIKRLVVTQLKESCFLILYLKKI